MSDSSLDHVVAKLREDADRLLETQAASVPAHALVLEHRRRRNSRRVLYGGSLTMLTLVVIGAVWSVAATRQLEVVRPAPREPRIVEHDVPFSETPRVAEQRAKPPAVVAVSARSKLPLPVLFVRTNSDGEQVVVPVFYLPDRSEPIEFSKLSPAQQRAVRKVLGLNQTPASRNPI